MATLSDDQICNNEGQTRRMNRRVNMAKQEEACIHAQILYINDTISEAKRELDGVSVDCMKLHILAEQ